MKIQREPKLYLKDQVVLDSLNTMTNCVLEINKTHNNITYTTKYMPYHTITNLNGYGILNKLP